MTPKRFIPHWERCLGRSLTIEERTAVVDARNACLTGKRDTVRAMLDALRSFSRRIEDDRREPKSQRQTVR
jgi:hypothetical protein